jgi:V/A-type H+-transporting ATPase subunit I
MLDNIEARAMLTAAAMKRVNLLVLEKDEPELLRALGRLKVLHLESAEAGPEAAKLLQSRPGRQQDLESSRRQLAHIEDLLAGLECDREGPQAELAQLSPAEIETQLGPIAAEVSEIRRQEAEIEAEGEAAATLLTDIEPYLGLGVPLEALGEGASLYFGFGVMPVEAFETLSAAPPDGAVLVPRRRPGPKVQELVVLAPKSAADAVRTALAKAGFKPYPAHPELRGLPEDLATEARERKKRLAEQQRTVDERRVRAGEQFSPTLRCLQRTAANEVRIIEARANFVYTGAACLISGWVPAVRVNEATETVLAQTRGAVVIEVLDPEPGSEPPTQFFHTRLLRPFQILVTTYGLPRYREIEPTAFVAISFLLMFGFMFGDVGHGAVLLAAGLVMRLRAGTQKLRDMAFLVMAAAVSSICFGVLYGSYFGPVAGWAVWVEPLAQDRPHDMMTLISVAMLAGAAIMTIGLIFNIYNRLRQGDLSGGLCDRFGLAGALVYWALLWVGVQAAAGVLGYSDTGVSRSTLWAALFIVVPCVLVIFLREPVMTIIHRRHGGHGESLVEAAVVAAVEVMETFTNYLANSLSFIRLAAYAVTHGALLLATLKMAAMLGHVPAAGKPLQILILVLGNAVIIALEGLVAAIQSVRLEYYEFFGKFFTANGRAYLPFEVE